MVRATVCVILALGSAACEGVVPRVVEAPPGEPLPGLTAADADRFLTGQALFGRAFGEEDGLGPLFNQTGCVSCHDLPTSGGHGAEPVRKATREDEGGRCDLLAAGGGDLLQFSVTERGRAAGLAPEGIPDGATAVTELFAPPLYGLGLVEALDPADLASRADPDDADGDGISGRVARTADGAPALFGMKAAHPTLDSFVEEATRGELGLTTPAHPRENRPQGRELPAEADGVADPEVDDGFLDAVTAYIRFLAPPAPTLPDDAGERAGVAEGAEVFRAIGCEGCHTPLLTTGANPNPALDRKTFRAYSDFLLHDMGPELASICGANAGSAEWRTTRLVGLRLRRQFLHNGRAQSLADAIGLHGGEAARSRDLFRALTPQARADLIRFLQSL